MSTEAMKLALEALESCDTGHITDGSRQWYDERLVDKAITALQEVLAQPQQEPVAWAIFTDAGNARMWSTFQPHLQKLADAEGLTITPLYTSPTAQSLPFGVGGGLVAIKTLLSRDPCAHANTTIQMIDSMLAKAALHKGDA